MEEAFHMVHGTYLNQANIKFIQQLREQEQLERELRQHDREIHNEDDASSSLDDSELEGFSTSRDSNDSLKFLNDSQSDTGNGINQFKGNTKESNPLLTSSSTNSTSDLIYLDLDVSKQNSNQPEDQNSKINLKRPLNFAGFDVEESSDSPTKSKQIRLDNNANLEAIEASHNSSEITTENCLSLDFLSNDMCLTSSTSEISSTHTATANVTLKPLDMSSNNSSSIDRITSLVSIFNFGNLQRPDLCSPSPSPLNHSSVDKNCCNISTQRQIAMTV